MRIPLLLPVAFLLWVLGSPRNAEEVYALVERKRLMIGRVARCEEARAIMQVRNREQGEVR